MLITSEYVSYGHPDKVADQISDALLDAYIAKDPNARCGIETLVKDNIVVLGGEVYSTEAVNHAAIAKRVMDGIGYPESHNINANSVRVIDLIGRQSPEIHDGVDRADGEIGAGDQGFVIGYATNDTPEMLPLGVYIAKKICQMVAKARRCGYGPDVKTQVIINYDDCDLCKNGVASILVSTMHDPKMSLRLVRDEIDEWIRNNDMELDEAIFNQYITPNTPIKVNPCGEWHVGGPISDCGVTGRKIVVDQYGGYCNVGGGGWSGKDMTKIDRSAAYMARYIAKNIVATGYFKTAKVEIAYTIGEPQPTAFNISLEGEHDNLRQLEDIVKLWFMEHISLTPSGIIDWFKQDSINYEYYSRNGHYGYTADQPNCPPWELTDMSRSLRYYLEESGAVERD